MIDKIEALKVLDMFLHKQCDLDRTKFAYSQEEVWYAVKIAKEALEKQFSQPERPKGRLVRRRKHYGECPECGEIISKLHNYCSNCGLEIVRGEEE